MSKKSKFDQIRDEMPPLAEAILLVSAAKVKILEEEEQGGVSGEKLEEYFVGHTEKDLENALRFLVDNGLMGKKDREEDKIDFLEN